MFSSTAAQQDIKKGQQGLPSGYEGRAEEEMKVRAIEQERLANDPNPVIRFANTPTVVGGLTPGQMAGLAGIAIGAWAVVTPRITSYIQFKRLPEYRALVDYAKANNISSESKAYQEAETALKSAFNLHKLGATEAADAIMESYYKAYARTVAQAPVQATETAALVSRDIRASVMAMGGAPKATPGGQLPQNIPIVPPTTIPETGKIIPKPTPEVTPAPEVTPPGTERVVPTVEPIPQAPEPIVKAPKLLSAEVPPEVQSAVVEVDGSPPKPPKDWDKAGKVLYDRFKKQVPDPTPSTVPLSDRVLRLWGKIEKVTHDELARLNWLGWQAEVDASMVRATPGQASQLYREVMQAIKKSLVGNEDLISYVDDYLMLRHQLEVMKATNRKHFTIKKGDINQRFTAKQVGLLFSQMKKELGVENYTKVKEAASHVPAMYNQILRGTDELTKEQIDGLISKYPWYNPVLFAKEGSIPVNINGKLTPRLVKQLTNLESDREQISPLMSLPSTITKRLQSQAINTARKSVAELAVDPKNEVLVGGDVEIVTKKPEGAFIDYFDNGQRKYLNLGKGAEWLAKDIELLQRQPSAPLIRMVRSLQNLSKMAFTTYNPGFMAWNTAFDGMVTYFQEGVGPWGFGKALVGNLKGIFADVPGLNEFRRSGGEMMGFFEKGAIEREKGITPYVKAESGQLVLKNPDSLKRFLNPFELIRELGLAGENAGRRAIYEKAIREGLSPKEAALRGRRGTVDFSRFSSASKHINDWFIYFNPALQGFYLPGRAIAKNPKVLWRLAAIVAGYIGLTFYNQSYDEYKDVRDSDKIGKLLVMLPSDEYDKYGKKVPRYITLLPLREFALFTSPIEYLMGKLRAEQPEAYRSLGQEWDYFYPVISPLSMISESGGIAMPTQVANTIQQILKNHDDFHNRSIVDDELKLLPPAQQYDSYTNKMAIRIGQATGLSPKKLDFFVSNMFGALGSDLLRIMDVAIQQIDKEQVDSRIANLVTELRSIPSTVPPNQIAVTREAFLEELSTEDRDLVLNMERIPDDSLPILSGIVSRFYRDYGGQVYATAKEKVLANRTIDEYPPEALEELQKTANENAENLSSGKISKYQYDQQRTRYRAYYSGQATGEWRQGMLEGAVSSAEVEKYMPEAYQRSEEFQAVSAFMEIRQKYIDDAGGVLDSATWDRIERQTIAELRQFYSGDAIQYALQHKDDWIDKLPEPARSIERRRSVEIASGRWWEDYRETKKTRGGVPMPSIKVPMPRMKVPMPKIKVPMP